MRKNEISFQQLLTRFYDKGTGVPHLLEAAAAVANALHCGATTMIKGTFMEKDFRDALGLKRGQYVNFRENRTAVGKDAPR